MYLISYLTRAWGAFLFAFMLGGMREAFVPREKMKGYLSSKSLRSFTATAN